MKKLILLSILSLFLGLSTYAAKDINAWKSEKTLEDQALTFKKNLNLWQGYYSFKEPQFMEFYTAVKDSINTLEKSINNNEEEISVLKKEISSLKIQLEETQQKLDTSKTSEATLETLGTTFDKNAFPGIMYGIIIGIALLAAFAFFLFLRSNQVTKSTEKKYLGLSDEFDNYKKRSLEREMKLNRELQTERNRKH